MLASRAAFANPAGYDDPVLKALAAAQNPAYHTLAPWAYRPFISANFPTPDWPIEYFTNGAQPLLPGLLRLLAAGPLPGHAVPAAWAAVQLRSALRSRQCSLPAGAHLQPVGQNPS